MLAAAGLPAAALRPWRLAANRVERFYRGGLLLERFRGDGADASDSNRPEDWIGSATRAWTRPGTPPSGEGLSRVEIDGHEVTIADLLAASPRDLAGAELVGAAGRPTTGVLVKLLDTGQRLPVHAHPDRAFAARHLGCPFGKAEAWIVLETRQIPGAEPPCVRLGFRRPVSWDELTGWIEGGQTEALLEALHQRPVAAGDVWFVPPGMAHSIGAGVFMIEIEEPSDFSIVAELRDVPIDPADAHLGLGWPVTVDAFDLRGYADDEIDRLRTVAPGIRSAAGARRLTPPDADPFFRAVRFDVAGRLRPDLEPSFLAGVVTRGGGTVRAAGGSLEVMSGEAFALPAAAVPDLELETAGDMSLVCCLPPRPADLRASLRAASDGRHAASGDMSR